MEPIETQIAERKALMQQWADEIERLIASKVGLSERQAMELEIDLQISSLRYKIGCGQWALQDLEQVVAEGRSPKRERPPLPNARRLGVVERQRIEREQRAKIRSTLNLPLGMDVNVHVGRVTDEKGDPQISIHIGPRRRLEDDA